MARKAPRKMYEGGVPFDPKTGDQLSYPLFGFEMRPNATFDDVLVFEGYTRGRSAVGLTFRRKSTGTRVKMFMADFNGVAALMTGGEIDGRWAFCKRGANYGVVRVGGGWPA